MVRRFRVSPIAGTLLAVMLPGACHGCGAGTVNVDAGGSTPAADLTGAPPLDMTGEPPRDLAGVRALPKPATQSEGLYMSPDAPWYRDVTGVPVAADSAAITQWMVSHAGPNGWGTGFMRVDFSLLAMEVPAGTPKIPVKPAEDCTPDCDTAPVPILPYGVVETGTVPALTDDPLSGYVCPGYANNEDCHTLLVARSEHRLYEMYRTLIRPDGITPGSHIWDTSRWDPNGRGQQCSSADAAGFPMAALLFTVEELQAGEIKHAIRFILPNDMIRASEYVAPATHGTRTTGPATSGPYGFRMRLRADYPVNNLSRPAQVVARALQKYGMLMSDGGNIALTAQSDALSKVKYDDLGFDTRSLSALKATDFDVLEDTPTIHVTFDCKRQPILQ